MSAESCSCCAVSLGANSRGGVSGEETGWKLGRHEGQCPICDEATGFIYVSEDLLVDPNIHVKDFLDTGRIHKMRN